ncbi:MAG: YkoP family protein [Rudaea sp.]
MSLYSMGRAGTVAIDRILKWQHGVFEYSQDPSCILRISRVRSPRRVVLSDGEQIDAGSPLLSLHLWNERISQFAAEDRLSGARLLRGMRFSLAELAAVVNSRPESQDVRGLYAETGFIQDASMEQAQRILCRLGFDLIEGEKPGWSVFRAAFWRNVFSWWLLRAFNPGSADMKSFPELRRCEVWMSRARLHEIYSARS